MAVRVDGDERKAEIQRRGRLHDSQTALSPLRVYRMHRFVTGDGDRDLRAPPRRSPGAGPCALTKARA